MYRELRSKKLGVFGMYPPSDAMPNKCMSIFDAVREPNADAVPPEVMAQNFTRNNVSFNFALWGLRQAGIDKNGGFYETNQGSTLAPNDMTSDLLFRTTFRGQDNKERKGVPIRWDGTKHFFNSTRFPAVCRYTKDKISHAFPCAFRVCYSSFEPMWSKDRFSGLLPHKPNWVLIHLQPDRNSTMTVPVYVDNTLIGDVHSKLALIASLENSSPREKSFIYILPDVNDQHLNDPQSHFFITQTHKVTGSSLGMAVFAAVSGWPDILYTGYIKYIVPEGKLQRNTAYQVSLADKMGAQASATQYWDQSPAMSQMISTKDGYRVYNNPIVRVVKQMNFVESIGDLPMKIAYASYTGRPLVFPSSSQDGESIHDFLNSASNVAAMRTYLDLMPEVYTMSMAQDASPVVRKVGNYDLGYALFSGSTVAEFQLLAAIANYSLYGGSQSYMKESAPMEKYAENLMERKIQQGEAMSSRALEESKWMKQAKEVYKDNPAGWVDAVRARRATRQKATKTKKEVASRTAKKKTDMHKEVRAKIRSLADGYKEAYAQARIAMGPKPTKAERALFNREWPSVARAKRQMNSRLIASLVGAELQAARATDTIAMKLGKRKAFVEKLRGVEGVNGGVAAHIANKIYHDLPPLDPNRNDPIAQSIQHQQDWRDHKAAGGTYVPNPQPQQQQQPQQQMQQPQQQQQQMQQPQQQQQMQQQQQQQQYNMNNGNDDDDDEEEDDRSFIPKPKPTDKKPSGPGRGKKAKSSAKIDVNAIADPTRAAMKLRDNMQHRFEYQTKQRDRRMQQQGATAVGPDPVDAGYQAFLDL